MYHNECCRNPVSLDPGMTRIELADIALGVASSHSANARSRQANRLKRIGSSSISQSSGSQSYLQVDWLDVRPRRQATSGASCAR
jgi:hypothetical protein